MRLNSLKLLGAVMGVAGEVILTRTNAYGLEQMQRALTSVANIDANPEARELSLKILSLVFPQT